MTQSQKGGAGSRQTQILGDVIIHQGVTEERAAEIAELRARQVLEEYSQEAVPQAFARIKELDERLVGLLASEGKLDALRDPAYQIALKKAQMSAASSEREADYELLARLLSQRANQGSRFARASVDRAVQIVDMIDDRSLDGLNMLWVISVFTPGGTSLTDGVLLLEKLLDHFPHVDLPRGARWLDHLDMIDLVRIVPGGLTSLKKFVPLFADKWPGLLSAGFEADVAGTITSQLAARGITSVGVVEHDLKPGYFRFPFQSAEQLRRVMSSGLIKSDVEFVIELALGQGNLEIRDDSLISRLEQLVSASPTLKNLSEWWDQIPDFPQPTSAGVALAYANSLRYYQFEDTSGLAEYLEQST